MNAATPPLEALKLLTLKLAARGRERRDTKTALGDDNSSVVILVKNTGQGQEESDKDRPVSTIGEDMNDNAMEILTGHQLVMDRLLILIHPSLETYT